MDRPLILALLLLAAPASAAPLTVEDAVRRALARPQLAAIVDGAAGAAAAEADARGRSANPELAYEHEQLFGSGSLEQAVVLSQRFDLGGVRSRRARAGRKRVEIARVEGVARRVGIEADVRGRFSNVQFRQRRHEVVQGWASRLERVHEVIVQREAAGEASMYDRKRIARELTRARAEVDVEATEREVAWMRLDALVNLGEAAQGWPRVAGDALPASAPAGGHDLTTRPDLRLLALDAAAAELDREAAERMAIPDLVVSAGWRSAAEDTRRHGFVAGLALDLPIFEDGRAQAAGARASQARALARRDLDLGEAGLEIEAARTRAARLTAAARAFHGTSAQAAAELVRTAELSYAGGELGLLELLDAYRGAADDALRVLELDRAARDAATTLWAATRGIDP